MRFLAEKQVIFDERNLAHKSLDSLTSLTYLRASCELDRILIQPAQNRRPSMREDQRTHRFRIHVRISVHHSGIGHSFRWATPTTRFRGCQEKQVILDGWATTVKGSHGLRVLQNLGFPPFWWSANMAQSSPRKTKFCHSRNLSRTVGQGVQNRSAEQAPVVVRLRQSFRSTKRGRRILRILALFITPVNFESKSTLGK